MIGVVRIYAMCMCLVVGSAFAQGAASSATAEMLPGPITSPEKASSGASAATVIVDQALRGDIAKILSTTAKIAKTQEDEGSLLLKVRDGFITSLLWELFGFKSTEKTIVGYAISFLGILGLIMKAVWFVSKNGEPEPTWAKTLTYAYMLVVVSIFTLLAFSGGVVSDVPASSSATKTLHEASVRLEAAAEKFLRINEGSPEIGATAGRGASAPQVGQGSLSAEALAALKVELNGISINSEAAAKMSAEAASKSSGWGWHLIIVLLLVGTIFIQLVVYEQTRP